eukprot:scpid2562/ scgid25860/ 
MHVKNDIILTPHSTVMIHTACLRHGLPTRHQHGSSQHLGLGFRGLIWATTDLHSESESSNVQSSFLEVFDPEREGRSDSSDIPVPTSLCASSAVENTPKLLRNSLALLTMEVEM